MYIRFWCFFLRFAVGGGVGRLGKRLAKPKKGVKGVTFFGTLEIHSNLVKCVEDVILSHM